MSENREEIKKILKKIDFKKNNLEEILKKKDRNYEIFFMNLCKEILIELKNINNIINNSPKNDFFKYDKNFLYQMIKLLINMRKNNIPNQILEYLISKDNIEKIINISVNINKNSNNFFDEEITKFNNNIIVLISDFLNLNQKVLIENLLFNNDNYFNDFLLIFSEYKNGRNFIYDCERIILLLYPNNENYKDFLEFINYTIDCINQQLNDESFLTTIEEIQLILYIYKNHINIISNSMIKILIKIFIINENKQEVENNNNNNFNKSINNLLRYCFDRIVFIFSDNANNNYKEIIIKTNFQYNKDFMNFLLEAYNQLIINKLKNSYSHFLMELFLGIDNIGSGTKKYIWLINETKYPDIVLKSLIELKDYNLLSLYFSKILFLSYPNLTEYYIPEFDIKYFISKIDIILSSGNEEDKEKMLNIISSQIINLININKINVNNDIIDILINKCSIIDKFISIVKSDNYSKNIKSNFINILENMLSVNNNNIKYVLNIPITNQLDIENNFDINDENTYGINYKIYLLSLEYDFNINEYKNKILLILNNMYHYYENKKIVELILFGDLLLKSILIDNKFEYIKEFNKDTISKINDIYIKTSTILVQRECINEQKNKDMINKFIYQIIHFIHEFNQKSFKFKKKKICKYNQLIIHENTINDIFKNILIHINDFLFKQNIINNICKIYLKGNEINENEEKKYILESPFLVTKLIEYLYEIKDYQGLLYLYSILFEIINFSSINIRLLIHYDIISITFKLLIDLYTNKMEEKENDKIYEECYNKAFLLLNLSIKYITQSLLIKYLKDIYLAFFDNIIDNKCINSKYKQIINKLFIILKENLKSSLKLQKQDFQYLSLSKKIFNNPFIFNIFYINNLQKNENIIHYNIDIRINNYNTIDNFYIVNFINEKINLSLFILINKKNQLVVGEKSINKNQINHLGLFENINEFLLTDNNFHNISIIIEVENKNIKILIDNKKINLHINEIKYNNFSFDEFGLFLGYDYETVNSFNNKKNINDVSIIDISNIFIINHKNEVDNYILKKIKDKAKKEYIIDTILEDLFLSKNKEYYYNFILVEEWFNINNIKIINSNKIIHNNFNSNIINKYFIKDNQIINKYVTYFEIFNPFLNNENTKLYMISMNKNIENFFSSNSILTIQNINKVTLKNIFNENFNIIYSSTNYFFIDFFIGFFYDIDKRKDYIENNQSKDESNLISLKDEYINEIIIIILDIILNLPNKKIVNYFLYENENLLKIKYFFKKNIYLLKDNLFLIKLINLLNNKIENLLIFAIEIFIDIIIFPLIDINNQNIILINIKNNLDCPKNEIIEENNPLLIKLLEKFYNLILYHQLYIVETKDDNNEKQIDIILKCILIIFEKIVKLKNIKLENQIIDLSNNIININSKLHDDNFQATHNIKLFQEKNENILNNNNSPIFNDKIKSQIELVSNSLNIYIFKLLSQRNIDIYENDSIENKENENVIIIEHKDRFNSYSYFNDSSDIIENINKDNDEQDISISNSNNCLFCSYLSNFFKINFDAIYDEIKYEKYKKKYYRYIFLNFKESRTKLGINNYSWYLSPNESGHKIQNKFFIKENNIKIIGKKKKTKDNLYTYKYMNDIEKFNKTAVKLQSIFIYDNICKDQHFIYSFKNKFIPDNKNILAENCLLINNIQKINCLFLIYNNFFLIIKHICVDNENKLHVAINEFDINIWCLKTEEYISELDNYIKNNEKEIINNYFDKKGKKRNDDQKEKEEFGYNKNYVFSIKMLKFSEINEIHKISFLQIPNSIEITTNKGKNYFLCFNIEKRDEIFMTMINNIININSNKFKKIKKKNSFTKKLNKVSIDDCFYMKHCPVNYLDNSKDNNIYNYLGINAKTLSKKSINYILKVKLNKKDIYNKAIIDKHIFLSEIGNLWVKNRISNFDYLMLLNTLAGRSLINLSQYFIFPFILKDFDHNILNWLNSSMYRDLSLPIYACYPQLNNNLSDLDMKKFEINEIGKKYHSGTFYSTHAFVSYYLMRQHPYTEIHLEIQGGSFDSADRLFIGTKELSSLEEKHQELIPSIYTLPELYINTNHFDFGKILNFSNEKKENEINKIVNDFILPKWAEGDPRKFTLVLRKILESKKVSQKLNNWIDLIFGYKMNGNDAIKSYNTYRKACYEISYDEIEQMKKDDLLSILYEKQELGYMGKQLLKKAHKKKEIISNEYKENENIFFDTNLKLRNINLIKINKIIDILNNKTSKINNIIIESSNDYINNSINSKNYYFQGGISSLKTIMNVLINEYNVYNKNITLSKLINLFEKEETKFTLLGKKNIFLGEPSNNVILQYNKNNIKILYNKYNAYSYYYLNEIGKISIIIANQKGSKLYIGFDNGNILTYKIKFCDKDKIFINDSNYIYPFKNVIPTGDPNNNLKGRKNGSFRLKRSGSSKNINNLSEVIMLEKIKINNFTMNNPHIPQKIKRLCLDEENNILIASTSFNMIYIISLNNNFKLMHIIPYFSKKYYNYQYKIKDIVPLFNDGDFIIYSSLTVHLFSINGLPICELNLLDKINHNIPKITYCVAVFIYDVVLFTGHKNGSIYIWKIKNNNMFQSSNSITNDDINNNNNYLPEYDYCYSFKFNKNNIKEFELQRKFDYVNQIKISQNININIPIKFMKMSNDLSYMIVINENKNIFILCNVEDDNANLNNDNTNLLSINKKKKIYCSWCSKDKEDCYYRATFITSLSNIKNEGSNEFESIDGKSLINKFEENNREEENKKEDKKNKDYTYICEECRQKLGHVDNYLYNF